MGRAVCDDRAGRQRPRPAAERLRSLSSGQFLECNERVLCRPRLTPVDGSRSLSARSLLLKRKPPGNLGQERHLAALAPSAAERAGCDPAG